MHRINWQTSFISPLNSSILTIGNAQQILVGDHGQSVRNCESIWRLGYLQIVPGECGFPPLIANEVELCLQYVIDNENLFTSRIFSPAKLNLMMRVLQYPSATKKSPFSRVATDVGLQKSFADLPGLNASPRVSSGLVVEFPMLKRKTWWSPTSVT